MSMQNIIIAIVAAVIIIVGGYYLFGSGDGEPAPETSEIPAEN